MARFFSIEQTSLITAVLNRVVPPDGLFPGAGDLGLAEFVDENISTSPKMRRNFTTGLNSLTFASLSRYSTAFTSLDIDKQNEILRVIESKQPEFFQELVRQTYNGYYTNPHILRTLGMEARPPQPKGYSLDNGNLGLIEHVKSRGVAYRKF